MNGTSRPGVPGRFARLATLGMIALLTGLAIPGSAFAGYPPGPFPGPAPGGAFRTIVTSVIVCPDGDVIDATYGHASVSLTIPAGAFVDCTQVTVYVADKAVLGPLIPSGYALADAFAVGWDADTAAGTPSVDALTMAIRDTAISSKAIALEVTATSVTKADSAVVAKGAVTFTFDSPAGFAVAIPDAVEVATAPPTSIVQPVTTVDPANGRLVALLVVTSIIASLLFLLSRARSRRIRR